MNNATEILYYQCWVMYDNGRPSHYAFVDSKCIPIEGQALHLNEIKNSGFYLLPLFGWRVKKKIIK